MKNKDTQLLEEAYRTISNINPVMTVFIVFKEGDYSDRVVSIHATEEGAVNECERLHKRQGTSRNPYFWEEQEVQP